MKLAIQALLLLALFAGLALDKWEHHERNTQKNYYIVGEHCYGERCAPTGIYQGFVFDCVRDVHILPGNAYYVLVDYIDSDGNRTVTKASADGAGPKIFPTETACKN